MRPKTDLTQGPLLTIQLTPEMAARVRAEAKTVNSNISRYLRQIITQHYEVIDTRTGETS